MSFVVVMFILVCMTHWLFHLAQVYNTVAPMYCVYCIVFNHVLLLQALSESQRVKREIITKAREKKPEITEDVKEKHRKHKETYGSTRQPLISGLTSDYDYELFREAQSRACELLVRHLLILLQNYISKTHFMSNNSYFEQLPHSYPVIFWNILHQSAWLHLSHSHSDMLFFNIFFTSALNNYIIHLQILLKTYSLTVL